MTTRGMGWLQGIRGRLVAVMIVGLLLGAVGFHATLLILTREWFARELSLEVRDVAKRMAMEAVVPLTIGDRVELTNIVDRTVSHDDLVGLSILGRDGSALAQRIIRPRLWIDPTQSRVSFDPTHTRLSWETVGRTQVLVLVEPVQRQAGSSTGPRDPGELFELHPGLGAQHLGWVRVELSTLRLEQTAATAARIGVLVLMAVLLLSILATTLLFPMVVTPLREASQLAREIAAGDLDRRLPVRGADELGTLAESMNSMAAALARTQASERAEAAALLETAEAVVGVARGAQAARDPGSAFHAVAGGLWRVTRCEGIALAVPSEESSDLRFTHFEPQPHWGGLDTHCALDGPLAFPPDGDDTPPIRVELDQTDHPLARRLSSNGFRTALSVPLVLERGTRAALLLASRDLGAFTPAEIRVVSGLSSHLSAALHAAQLRSRLRMAFLELQQTRERMVQGEKLRATGEMASGVAHEFNNVLSAILGRVELLRRKIIKGTLGSGELVDSLGVMELAARDGAETVRLLRQFSKGDEDSGMEPVDLDAALRESIEFTRPTWKDLPEAEDRPVRMEIDSSPGAIVLGRASQLREVFTNLIMNAVDALPTGGKVRVSTSITADRVTAVVEDDGIGMSEEIQRRIFDPFFTTKGARGTGLGLSVVYGAVQRHHGTLNVESQVGVGTRIEITFPRAVAAPLAAVEPPPDEVRSPAVTVMIVDDEDSVRDLLVEIVQELEQEAVPYRSGESALEGFAPGRFDLVMTDLGMPGMSGWQLAEKIRAIDSTVPIAIITGWGHSIDQAQMERVGAEVAVAKPFSIDDISKLLESIARRKGRRAA